MRVFNIAYGIKVNREWIENWSSVNVLAKNGHEAITKAGKYIQKNDIEGWTLEGVKLVCEVEG